MYRSKRIQNKTCIAQNAKHTFEHMFKRVMLKPNSELEVRIYVCIQQVYIYILKCLPTVHKHGIILFSCCLQGEALAAERVVLCASEQIIFDNQIWKTTQSKCEKSMFEKHQF